MTQRAIGIFDSGVGGLTVFKEIARMLPGENLIYLGDTARVPYGTKSTPTVQMYAREAAEFLIEQGVKLLIVACNTASAVALPQLREQFQLPVLGVIEPGARRAIQSQNRKIGVIGTEGTINSGRYPEAIHKLLPEARIISVPCPLFVPLAEEGWADHQVAAQVAGEYLQPLIKAQVDTLVLGCTHYPLLHTTIQTVMGPRVTLVDSAVETAEAVKDIFRRQGLANPRHGGQRSFFVTDVPARFERVGRAFLGGDLPRAEQIRLG